MAYYVVCGVGWGWVAGNATGVGPLAGPSQQRTAGLADLSPDAFNALVAAALARVANTTTALHEVERRREELMVAREQGKVRGVCG
jgi:hypothetical protein